MRKKTKPNEEVLKERINKLRGEVRRLKKVVKQQEEIILHLKNKYDKDIKKKPSKTDCPKKHLRNQLKERFSTYRKEE